MAGERKPSRRWALAGSLVLHAVLLVGLVAATAVVERDVLAEKGSGQTMTAVALMTSAEKNPPQPRATPRPEPTPLPTPKATPRPAATPKPDPTPRATPKPTATPKATPKPEPTPRETPKPEPTPKPRVEPPRETPKPTPRATPVPSRSPAPTPEPTPDKSRAALSPDRARDLRPVPTRPAKKPDASPARTPPPGSAGGSAVGSAENKDVGSIRGVGLPDYYARMALNRLARYFRVPPDQQRDVHAVLACRIARDGRISNIRIVRSCGDRALDQIALRALETTRRFGPFPDDFEKPHVDVEIQFIFEQ